MAPPPWQETPTKAIIEFRKVSGLVHRRVQLTHSREAMPSQLQHRIPFELWTQLLTGRLTKLPAQSGNQQPRLPVQLSALGRYELLDSTCLPLRHAIITCTLRSASTELQYQAEQHPFAWQPEEGSCFAWCGGYCCILCIAIGRVLGDDGIATKIWIEQVGSKW